MEMELKSLIDKIKKEGVEEAEKTADSIKKQAEEKAQEIITSAKKEKASILEDAEQKTKALKKNSQKAMKQAARDILLSLRGQASDFFDRIVKEKITKELSPDVLKEVIVRAANNLKKDGILDIEVLVSKEDRDKLQKSLFTSFGQEAKKHLKLTGTKSIKKGFRIGEQDKNYYFDFTNEAITEAFKRYLDPKLVDMLDIGLGLGKEK